MRWYHYFWKWKKQPGEVPQTVQSLPEKETEVSVPIIESKTPPSLQKFGKSLSTKVVDYPASKYNAYWEVVRGKEGHKHTAEVRFYGKGKLLSTSKISNSSWDVVTDQIDALIQTKMSGYKKA